jgi:hypothetical protein
VFERFDDSARRAVASAGQFARYLRQEHIGTGHLLFGVASAVGQDLAPVAGDVILRLGADPQSIRDLLLARLKEGTEPSPGHIPFTADVKTALEHAARIADAIGSNHIGAEHLLAGIAGDADSTAGNLLAGLGITDTAVADAISRPVPASPTAARTCTVYVPAGKSVFRNGGKIYPDLATASAAHPDKEIAPFPLQLNDGEFFDVGEVLLGNRFKSWGSFTDYRAAFAAAAEFRKNASGCDIVVRLMVPDVQEMRGKDSSGHDVVLGRSVEYNRVALIHRLAATVG